jgi:hypothetical protein|tara:strand:+ start:806 stop:2125 length:1320 start_codon:yes stop_codon:yes gene_type:complete
MIELTAIFIQFFLFLIICSFPFNPKNLNKLIRSPESSFNYIDCHAINIIVLINILLITSFFNIQLRYTFLTLLLFSSIFLVLRRKEVLLLINRKNITKFIFFFIVTISIFISTAQSLKLEWDGFHWITKALVFFNDTEIQNLKYSEMFQYPHLGGYIWAFFWKNSLLELEYFGRLFYIYFYLISIFTVFNIAKFKSDKLIFILIFSLIFLTYDPYLFGGYQEYLIFSTLIIAARFISTINFTKKIEYKKIFLILLIMSLLMWFKNEGIFYLLIFGTLLIILNNNSNTSKLLLFILILSVIYLQKFLQENIIGIYGMNGQYMNDQFVEHLLNFKPLMLQALAISKHIIIATIKYPLWILIFFSFIFSNTFKNKKGSFIKYLFFAFILNILFIYSIYLYAPITNEHILSVTMDRIMFQTSGFYIPVLILILNKTKLSSSNF